MGMGRCCYNLHVSTPEMQLLEQFQTDISHLKEEGETSHYFTIKCGKEFIFSDRTGKDYAARSLKLNDRIFPKDLLDDDSKEFDVI